VNQGFLCVDDVCRQECDPNAEPSECRAGAACLPVSEGGPSYCQPSDCNGWLDTTSCDAGAKCIAFNNDADLCIPAGAGAEGDACDQTGACGAGLICAFGACQPLCGADSECDEAGGERCVGVDEPGLLDTNVGICEVGCDSYSFGQCPDGQGCFPITSDDGICDDVGDAGRYDACADPEDCGDGTTCITFQAEDAGNNIPQVGRCLPFCDPTLDTQAAMNATCPSGGADAGWGRFVHLAEGAGMVDIYVDDALAVDDLAFEGASDAGAFMELTAGAHTIDVTAFDAADNSSPIITLNPTIANNDALTWGLIPDAADTLAAITLDVPRNEAAPTAGSSKVRAVHAIPDFGGNADVVAIPAGETDFTNQVELALDIALGESGSFVELTAGDWDIFAFPAGGARDVANPDGVTVAGVAIPADETFSSFARGTTDAGDAADPGLTNLAYMSAPSAGGLNGFCLDLSGGQPTPNSGVCVEECPSTDAYGTGVCSNASDYCTPQAGRDTHLCFPGGPNGPGEACSPNNSADGCDGTSFCQPFGDGSGLCKPYCQPVTQSNPSLGCEGTDTCRQVGDDALNAGLCNVACTPDASFADTTACPANLQTCHPPAAGEDAYCAPSGSTAVGGACSVDAPTCEPGDSCVNDFARGDLSADDPFAEGACADSCAVFGDGSDCGGTEVCALNWLTLNTAVGLCTEPDVAADGCQNQFDVCGNNSLCLDVGMGVQCLEMCDLDNDACSAGSCTQLFQSAAIRVGGCI
jgi:hypothetical protein